MRLIDSEKNVRGSTNIFISDRAPQNPLPIRMVRKKPVPIGYTVSDLFRAFRPLAHTTDHRRPA